MNVNQLNPDTLKLIDLPEEILKTICHNLTIPALNALQKLSKQFHQIANDPLLWEKLIEKYEINLLPFLSPSDKKNNPKKMLEFFSRHKLGMPERKLYAHVARIIGLEIFDNLPTFQDLKNNKPWAPIMKRFNFYNKPTIVLRYVNRSETFPLEKKVASLSSLLINNPKRWFSNDSGELFYKGGVLNAKEIDRFNRLLKHEPCGGTNELVNPQAPRTMPSGESIFELV